MKWNLKISNKNWKESGKPELEAKLRNLSTQLC